MVEDTVLKEASKKNTDNVTWGNYTTHYDWRWVDDKPLLIPYTLGVSAGVMIRDWTIARKLKELGVKKVLDIGSDTGHFIAVLTSLGIEAVGIDADESVCKRIAEKKINACYPVGIQSLIKLNIHGYDCITCMNITHATWADETLKRDLITWIGYNTTYTVLSDFTHQDKKWGRLHLIHDFNMLPFYCSPLVVKIAQKINLEKIISYPGIQKLYKVTGEVS